MATKPAISQTDRLRAKLAEIEEHIAFVREEAARLSLEYTKMHHSLMKLAEHKSDCMKKLAEAHAIELMNKGELD